MPDLALILAASEQGDFFTKEALATFTGASLATVVVATALRYGLKMTSPVLPLVVGIVFAYVAAEITGNPRDAGDFLLVLLNGCLLFWTALGANTTIAAAAEEKPADKAVAQGRARPQLLDRWV